MTKEKKKSNLKSEAEGGEKMAKVKAPLFGFGASGKIGGALVYGIWKGIDWVREYVIPANPKTAAQTAQRALITIITYAWKNVYTTASGRDAWKALALRYPKIMSGFNAFGRNALLVAASDPNASFARHCSPLAGQKVTAGMRDLDDPDAASEAGNFEIWVGSTPTNMVLNEELAIGANDLTGTNDLGDAADIVYVKIRKGGYDRSGIFKLTLQA